eukprot:TRINITY_DN6194_c0_g1_i1.p1 TRINITY_DN6194_c0_g1~~TRINITY_DN6194_c0_g1_i1.p1  ORF type:complete len:511 (-),score=40.54 TRINITY_DN6194_c0_g1_i1:113-1594(-)
MSHNFNQTYVQVRLGHLFNLPDLSIPVMCATVDISEVIEQFLNMVEIGERLVENRLIQFAARALARSPMIRTVPEDLHPDLLCGAAIEFRRLLSANQLVAFRSLSENVGRTLRFVQKRAQPLPEFRCEAQIRANVTIRSLDVHKRETTFHAELDCLRVCDVRDRLATVDRLAHHLHIMRADDPSREMSDGEYIHEWSGAPGTHTIVAFHDPDQVEIFVPVWTEGCHSKLVLLGPIPLMCNDTIQELTDRARDGDLPSLHFNIPTLQFCSPLPFKPSANARATLRELVVRNLLWCMAPAAAQQTLSIQQIPQWRLHIANLIRSMGFDEALCDWASRLNNDPVQALLWVTNLNRLLGNTTPNPLVLVVQRLGLRFDPQSKLAVLGHLILSSAEVLDVLCCVRGNVESAVDRLLAATATGTVDRTPPPAETIQDRRARHRAELERRYPQLQAAVIEVALSSSGDDFHEIDQWIQHNWKHRVRSADEPADKRARVAE